MWWGVFIAGVPVFLEDTIGYVTVASPLFTMFVLIAFTGIPQAEGPNAKRWYDGGEAQLRYEAYFESTPYAPQDLQPCTPTPVSGCLASLKGESSSLS